MEQEVVDQALHEQADQVGAHLDVGQADARRGGEDLPHRQVQLLLLGASQRHQVGDLARLLGEHAPQPRALGVDRKCHREGLADQLGDILAPDLSDLNLLEDPLAQP